jgi:hypothetical protein
VDNPEVWFWPKADMSADQALDACCEPFLTREILSSVSVAARDDLTIPAWLDRSREVTS